MESIAKMTIRQSSKKVRFVLDEIRNSNINDALAKLTFINKKAAKNIYKTIIFNEVTDTFWYISCQLIPT